MRCAIISDIHANLAAFTAVLGDIKAQGGVDKIWCLGDIVGYGPDPHECIEALRQIDHICVAGNHDLAAAGKISIEEFNPDAAEACRWTAGQLIPSDKAYLKKLPLVVRQGDFTLVHGSLRDPVWEYVLDAGLAAENFALMATRFCLLGHSHVPLVFNQRANGEVSGLRFTNEINVAARTDRMIINPGNSNGEVSGRRFTNEINVAPGRDRMIINPGGVGQPRDGDPRASYAIYDTRSGLISLHRVSYDIGATQDRMTKFGLPVSLITRLSYGL